MLLSYTRENVWCNRHLTTKTKPVNQQRNSPTTQLQGQTGRSVPVHVSSGGARKQEDLRGLLIRNWWRQDGGGVFIDVRLFARMSDLTTRFLGNAATH